MAATKDFIYKALKNYYKDKRDKERRGKKESNFSAIVSHKNQPDSNGLEFRNGLN